MDLKKVLRAPKKLIYHFGMKGYLHFLSDKAYLKLMFYCRFDRKLNLSNPVTYNEKLQWLKLYDRKEIYPKLVDKLEVKNLLKTTIDEKYIIPTLGVWNNFEEIDFSKLPNEFVLKCTHDSGGIVVCKNKKHFNIQEARKKINRCLKHNYFYIGREWPYKKIKPRIIAEQYIGDINSIPEDYKFYTFNGKIDCVMICKDRELGHPKFLFYDINWNRLNYLNEEIILNKEEEKPTNFEKMLEIVEILSKDTKQMRVDLYNVNGNIYFGELTLFNQSGFDTDISLETDIYWGRKLTL